MLIATVLFGAILCAALLFYGCGDNPSTDVKDAVFDQSVMFISGNLTHRLNRRLTLTGSIGSSRSGRTMDCHIWLRGAGGLAMHHGQ